MDSPNNGIVLYHYSFSPYARRVLWYLALRGLDYAECKQPVTLPRPDLSLLNIHYRRIPVMAIGRDVYLDTRLHLRKLEFLFSSTSPSSSFPHNLTPKSTSDRSLAHLFEIYSIEAGLFTRASQLIPSDMPLLRDPKFAKDREDFSGRKWSKEEIERNRPEALGVVRRAFGLVEGWLGDGRMWVLGKGEGGEGVTVGDLDAIFIFDWLVGLKGALPEEVVSPKEFPLVYAYIERFNKVVKEAKAKAPKPASLKGEEAAKRILSAAYADKEIGVNAADPLGLKQGQEVEVWASDMASGYKYRDRGTLIGLDDEEVVIIVKTGTAGGEIRLHAPRSGFRVAAVSTQAKL